MSIQLKKADLQYEYDWTAGNGDDPSITGAPDSRMFNRHQGYEVLYLINAFLKKHKMKAMASGNKVEDMLQKLPSNIRSRANVVSWLETNWRTWSK